MKGRFSLIMDFVISEARSEELNFGGEAGIRTLGRLPFNGFQDRRFRPLSHLSDRAEYYIKLYFFANDFSPLILFDLMHALRIYNSQNLEG